MSRLLRGHARLALMFVALLGGLLSTPSPAWANCPDRPACTGCGCKGGPGYRGPNGKCVGFAELDRVCGVPATLRCSFENAPGTGLNQSCALGLNQEEDR